MGLFNKKELIKIEQLEQELNDLKSIQKKLGITDYVDANKRIEKEQIEANVILDVANRKAEDLVHEIGEMKNSQQELISQNEDWDKKLNNSINKINRLKSQYKTFEYALENYNNSEFSAKVIISQEILDSIELLSPTVILHLNCLNIQELKKAYKENEKLIKKTLDSYKGRYTTKANQTIYKLMVIALQSELQNILVALKYDKLEVGISAIKELCQKYLAIAADGNQNIVGTVKKFIGEIECLFINAVKIEYEYYIKKERERAEQAAIREQIRQETEERRILEQQKVQIEKEESKYLTEMDNIKMQIENTEDDKKLELLKNKILELESKLVKVNEQKEEIISRQNGKAGNVYIISNLGSFGDNVFKVGMTRRLEPMDRVRELSDASVPFNFDVHAMIFSEDAVSLENKLHTILDNKRLNKINLRKEFFKVPLDEIEAIVLNEDPAVDFNRTLIAEQYRQTLSIDNGELK